MFVFLSMINLKSVFGVDASDEFLFSFLCCFTPVSRAGPDVSTEDEENCEGHPQLWTQ